MKKSKLALIVALSGCLMTQVYAAIPQRKQQPLLYQTNLSVNSNSVLSNFMLNILNQPQALWYGHVQSHVLYWNSGSLLSIGSGYRTILNPRWIGGTHAHIDIGQLPHGAAYYGKLKLGAELKSSKWNISVNGDIPPLFGLSVDCTQALVEQSKIKFYQGHQSFRRDYIDPQRATGNLKVELTASKFSVFSSFYTLSHPSYRTTLIIPHVCNVKMPINVGILGGMAWKANANVSIHMKSGWDIFRGLYFSAGCSLHADNYPYRQMMQRRLLGMPDRNSIPISTSQKRVVENHLYFFRNNTSTLNNEELEATYEAPAKMFNQNILNILQVQDDAKLLLAYSGKFDVGVETRIKQNQTLEGRPNNFSSTDSFSLTNSDKPILQGVMCLEGTIRKVRIQPRLASQQTKYTEKDQNSEIVRTVTGIKIGEDSKESPKIRPSVKIQEVSIGTNTTKAPYLANIRANWCHMNIEKVALKDALADLSSVALDIKNSTVDMKAVEISRACQALNLVGNKVQIESSVLTATHQFLARIKDSIVQINSSSMILKPTLSSPSLVNLIGMDIVNSTLCLSSNKNSRNSTENYNSSLTLHASQDNQNLIAFWMQRSGSSLQLVNTTIVFNLGSYKGCKLHLFTRDSLSKKEKFRAITFTDVAVKQIGTQDAINSATIIYPPRKSRLFSDEYAKDYRVNITWCAPEIIEKPADNNMPVATLLPIVTKANSTLLKNTEKKKQPVQTLPPENQNFVPDTTQDMPLSNTNHFTSTPQRAEYPTTIKRRSARHSVRMPNGLPPRGRFPVKAQGAKSPQLRAKQFRSNSSARSSQLNSPAKSPKLKQLYKFMNSPKRLQTEPPLPEKINIAPAVITIKNLMNEYIPLSSQAEFIFRYKFSRKEQRDMISKITKNATILHEKLFIALAKPGNPLPEGIGSQLRRATAFTPEQTRMFEDFLYSQGINKDPKKTFVNNLQLQSTKERQQWIDRENTIDMALANPLAEEDVMWTYFPKLEKQNNLKLLPEDYKNNLLMRNIAEGLLNEKKEQFSNKVNITKALHDAIDILSASLEEERRTPATPKARSFLDSGSKPLLALNIPVDKSGVTQTIDSKVVVNNMLSEILSEQSSLNSKTVPSFLEEVRKNYSVMEKSQKIETLDDFMNNFAKRYTTIEPIQQTTGNLIIKIFAEVQETTQSPNVPNSGQKRARSPLIPSV